MRNNYARHHVILNMSSHEKQQAARCERAAIRGERHGVAGITRNALATVACRVGGVAGDGRPLGARKKRATAVKAMAATAIYEEAGDVK